MKQVYESGLAQSKGVYQLYQALAIAEATISTYKAAQAAYAQGMEWGGPVVGAIMAATAVAAGMARCCRHQEHAAERVRVRRAHRRAG